MAPHDGEHRTALTDRPDRSVRTAGDAASAEDSALSVSGLSVSYGKFLAVGSATFTVSPGECVAIIGPNGHGKSSLVTALAGLVRRGGTVHAFGRAIPAGDPKAAVVAGLSLVPERRHLYPSLSTRDNIMLGNYSKTKRRSARRAWQDVADVLDIFPELTRLLDQKAGTLSGGQQQMVALARAMSARPRVLMLDEPCLGLAEAVTRRVYDWLGDVARTTDMTVVLVEENPINALALADRALRMHQGVLQGDLGVPGDGSAGGSAGGAAAPDAAPADPAGAGLAPAADRPVEVAGP